MGTAKSREPHHPTGHKGTPRTATVAPAKHRAQFLVAALIAFVVATVAIVHYPALSAQALAFDDSQYLVDNRLVRNPSWDSAKRFLTEVLEPSTVGGYYQPLTMISLMLDDAAGGRPDNLRAFHRTSLALHAINTGLVLLLLYLLFPLTRRLPAYREGPRNAASPPALDTRRALCVEERRSRVACQGPAADAACQGFGNPWPAAAAALLFGLHPLTVEPIPWVGERKTLLAAFFALLSLIAYVRYARRPTSEPRAPASRSGWRPYAACLAAYLLALMAKPTSTPLPLVMLLMDFWPLQRLSKRSLVEKLPLFALGAVFAVITVVSQGRTAHLTMPTEYAPLRIPLLLCHNIVFYLLKILCPIHLTPHYPLPEPLRLSADPMLLAGVVGTCILLPVLLLSLRRTRAFATGWLIFFVTLLPTTGIIGFTIVIASDKYAYLPSVGLLMVLAWAIGLLADRIARSSRPDAGLAAALIALMFVVTAESVATRRQVAHWQETENLYRYMLDLAPNSARLHTILGDILSDRGRPKEAVAAHRRALELRPDFPEALNNLGPLLAQQNDIAGAEKCFRKSLGIWPDNPTALSNLGIILAGRGDLKAAVEYFERSLALQPRSSETNNNLGNVLAQLGRIPDALPHYRRAIELDPENTQARSNLALALKRQTELATRPAL